jgi:hypothetical protein
VVQRHSIRHANRTLEQLRLVTYLSSLKRRTVSGGGGVVVMGGD